MESFKNVFTDKTIGIISIYFRQLKKNRNKTKSLNKEANQEDMKKLFVNAQVTATISLIEMGTNVLHTTLLKYYRGTNFYNLLQSMIVYDIVLPYAFLMNTSHNKKRIVESGWKNIFKNIIGITDNVVDSQEDISKDVAKKQNVFLEASITTKSTRNNEVSKTGSIHDSLAINTVDHSVSVTPQLNEAPSTSGHVNVYKPDFHALSVKALLAQGCYQDVVRRQVLEMRNLENDEHLYLNYFRRLVSFQDQRNKGIAISSVELEDAFVPSNRKCQKSKNRHAKGRNKYGETSIYLLDVQTDSMVSNPKLEEDNDVNHMKFNLKYDIKYRNSKREKLLEEIDNAAANEQACDVLIEKLIQVEENFVPEN